MCSARAGGIVSHIYSLCVTMRSFSLCFLFVFIVFASVRETLRGMRLVSPPATLFCLHFDAGGTFAPLRVRR